MPQTTEQAYVDALVAAVERATVPALALAVLLALLAARGVLRPVRALRRATRSIAEGRLDTRLAVDGSDELADLSHTFNETAAALEESVAELRGMEARARRFAADVSHELRTPLAAMSAVTDVLDEDADRLDPDTATAVRLISEETVKLARLVDDLMEISRFDAGAAVLHLDEIDLAESLRRTLAARAWTDLVDTDLPPPDALRGRVDPPAPRRGRRQPGRQRPAARRPPGPVCACDARRAGGRRSSRCWTAGPASPRTSCRTSSSASTSRTPPAPAPRAAVWAWRSPRRTSGCTAAPSAPPTARRRRGLHRRTPAAPRGGGEPTADGTPEDADFPEDTA